MDWNDIPVQGVAVQALKGAWVSTKNCSQSTQTIVCTIACKEHMLQRRTCTHVAVHVHMHISI